MNNQPTPSLKSMKRALIDTSIVKLRAKYKWVKDKWRQYTDRAKSGSGKAAIDEPEWFHIIDPIFSETNTKLKVATKADDLMSSENEEDSDGEMNDELRDEIVNDRNLVGSQQPSPLSIQSNTSYDGTTSGSVELMASSDEEDHQTDHR